MDVRHLIQGIVAQTTVLIAQLSTASGIRAPLSRLADEVFLNLARELEAQGVGRKVAADMFGLALRSYQLKITRLSASATESEQTLWAAVLGYLGTAESRSRRELAEHFARDDIGDLAAVLNDLVDSGLVSRAGRGDHAENRRTGPQAAAAIAERQHDQALANLAWLDAFWGVHRANSRYWVCSISKQDGAITHIVEAPHYGGTVQPGVAPLLITRPPLREPLAHAA